MIEETNKKLSIILPIFNEVGNIIEVYNRILDIIIIKLNLDYEIIFIDDGSSDGSWNIIKKLHKSDKNVKGICFSRNFGHQSALKAGIDLSEGDAVIMMDADLQHPPEMITDLFQKWKEGFKIVQAIRKDTKGVSLFKEFYSKIFYKVINFLSEVKITRGSSDFRLLDKQVVEELKKIKENQLFLRGIIPWLGFSKTNIEYVSPERFSGETKYSFMKMLEFAVNGIMSFSIKPLRISILSGLFVSLVAFIYIIYVLIANFIYKVTLPGWTSIMISVLFLGGIQLISFGVLGEYLGKLYFENKKRVNYIVGEKIT